MGYRPQNLSRPVAPADIAGVKGRLVTVCAISALALLASLATNSAPGDAATPLRSHIRLGAWVKPMVADPQVLTDLETTVGRPFDIASYFYGFGDWFPTDIERGFAAGGKRDVLISWDMGDTRFTDWTQGRHDDYLRTIGRLASAYPYALYVRPWPEMNGDWQTFMPTASGDRPNGGTPAQFREAWKHVVDTVRAAGGSNIKWVFNPYAATYEGTADVRQLWPGAGYVDVLGIDGYNWGGGPAPWQSFNTIFGPMYSILTSLDPGLPVWICEFASREPSVNDGAAILPAASKGQWINEAFTSTAFPRVSALVWFHEKKERDWRIDSSADSLAAFREQAALVGGTPTVSPSPTPTPTATTKPKKKPRSAMRVVSSSSSRITLAVTPATRVRLAIKRMGRGGWQTIGRLHTNRRGRAVIRRTASSLQVVAPALERRVVVAGLT